MFKFFICIFRKTFNVVRIVENLLYVNYCPDKCLKLVMDPECIKKISRDNVFNLKENYLHIDYCLELDHPSYNGQRLSLEMRNFLTEVSILFTLQLQ